MITLPNLICSWLHVGTEAEGIVSPEKLCTVGSGNSGACGGKENLSNNRNNVEHSVDNFLQVTQAVR